MKYGQLTTQEAVDRGFLPATVLVDGIPCHHCVLFNDVENWADVGVIDDKGMLKMNSNEEDVETVRIYGKVEYIPNVKPKEYRGLYK